MSLRKFSRAKAIAIAVLLAVGAIALKAAEILQLVPELQ